MCESELWLQVDELWLKYGKSLKTADSCNRRFTATLNRSEVFEAVITRTLQQAGCTVSEKQTLVNSTDSEKETLVNRHMSDASCVADCSLSEKQTLVSCTASEKDTLVSCTGSEKQTSIDCTASEKETLVNDPVSDSCVADRTLSEKQTLVKCTESEKETLVSCTASEKDSLINKRLSAAIHVAVILNCSRPIHTDNNLSDMTATQLRQLLISQHIHALLTDARSVIL